MCNGFIQLTSPGSLNAEAEELNVVHICVLRSKFWGSDIGDDSHYPTLLVWIPTLFASVHCHPLSFPWSTCLSLAAGAYRIVLTSLHVTVK